MNNKMKTRKILIGCLSMGLLAACSDVSDKMDENYNYNRDINYELRTVLEKDPVNINGIDVYPYFDFFKTLRLNIHITDGKMTSLSFDNGDIPFSAYGFDIPEGEVACEFDTSVSPNVLKIKGADNVVAIFKDGEFYVPFNLDCEEITYEFRFKEIK